MIPAIDKAFVGPTIQIEAVKGTLSVEGEGWENSDAERQRR